MSETIIPQHVSPKQSPPLVILQQTKTGLYLFYSLALMGLLFPFLALISFLLFLIALLFSYLNPDFGRFARYHDVWMDEDFTDNYPRSQIITTMTLQGHLSLDHLKTLVTTSILQARLSSNPSQLRYPELRQYLTSFMGFRIWKNDPTFNIDNHVLLKPHRGPIDSQLLQSLHEELMNKPYHRTRSPWQMVLVTSGQGESVLACRFHHAMIDGKSILKMLVECLAHKPLKTAQPTVQSRTVLDLLQFYGLFIFNYYYQNSCIFYKLCKSHSHPLKQHRFRADKHSKLTIAFSPKLALSDLKQVAKQNEVTSSAVVMSLVAGVVRKCGGDYQNREVVMGYPLPKDDHPEVMANHVYMAVLPLPTQEASAFQRLHKCNEIFLEAKASQLGKFTNLIAMQAGQLIWPLSRKLTVNHFLPMFVTNIAGEGEGFAVGGGPCTDFRMSVGTLEGVASLLFCVFSYKEGIRVGVTAKESVLSREETERIAKDIEGELRMLLDS